MTPEELEFSIAQYSDGTLAAEETAALQALLAGDSDAVALLAEYRALDAALKTAPGPAVNWDAFAGSTADLVAAQAGAAIPEDLEAAIAHFADETLADSERPTVEVALVESAAARVMLADYQSLDRALKDVATPSIRWDRLSEVISDAVARQADGVLSEELEFAVAQYADGTLAADRYIDLEEQLAVDGAAVGALGRYKRIDALAKSLPMPAVNWDRLAGHISETIAAADEADQQQASRFRISNWLKAPAWMALAASVMLGIGLSAWLFQHGRGSTARPIIIRGEEVAQIIGPKVESSSGEVVGQITIGPPPSLADLPEDDFASRPSRTIVTGGAVAEREVGFIP